MKTLKAEVVVCGAGIAGVSAAYHLAVEQGIKDIILVDERPPLTLTSDKSTECYRNWWPGPDNTMVQFTNRSIDLLEKLADESNNYFHMNRRGYMFLTGNPDHLSVMRKTAETISGLGAGPLRIHHGEQDDPIYPPPISKGYDKQLSGVDLILDPAWIKKAYPFITKKVVGLLHVRRCGWLSAQQLGIYLLDKAKSAGTQFLKAQITDMTTRSGKIDTVTVQTETETMQLSAEKVVLAVGPLLKPVASMIDVDMPVYNELHGNIAFNDPEGIISRDAPMMIWEDPIVPYWSEEENKELGENEETRWLTEEFVGGVHFRPEGGAGSQSILGIWTYDIDVHEPVFPPVFDDEYAEIVIRGLTQMIPGLSVYLDKMSKPLVDGGYYCKTKENRPLIGPLPVEGAYVIGALSGFGIMTAMAAGELLACHVAGKRLPDYAEAFLLSRYQDPEYQKLIEAMDATSGQL